MKIKRSVEKAMETLQLETLRKHQCRPINSILEGKDTLVIYPTGAGKSAIFQIPALVGACGWALVIEPTVSLIHDQVKTLQAKGVAAEMLIDHNKDKHASILERVKKYQTAFLYVTPERLGSWSFQQTIQCAPPGLIVVDEAHCVLDWGYTFRSSYLKIGTFIKGLKRRPIVAAMTATAPEKHRAEICRVLGMEKPEIYTHTLDRPNITLLKEDHAKLTIKRRLARINYDIKKYGTAGRVVVYCATRKNVDMVANYLSDRFPGEVVKCHGYMDSEKRERHELQFIDGKKRIMVATTAFGMGVDVPDVRLILHFNLPLSVIDYYQQIGRAGRDGKAAHAILLYHPSDIELGRSIIEKSGPGTKLHKWLTRRLDEMDSIARSDGCLMQQTLAALGEEHPKTCRHCTNCQRARRARR